MAAEPIIRTRGDARRSGRRWLEVRRGERAELALGLLDRSLGLLREALDPGQLALQALDLTASALQIAA